MTTGELEGKTALVTGAARGIGSAIAEVLAREGAAVVTADIDERMLREAAAALVANDGYRVEAVVTDIADADSCGRAVSAARDRFGGLDVLVNCAGLWRDAFMSKMTQEMWDLVVRVNLTGTFLMTQAALPALKDSAGPSIVNLTSQAGLGGNLGQANYSAAKAGIIGLTKSNAKELARDGIRVNAVAPIAATEAVGSMPDALRERFTKAIPLRRFGDPEEIGEVVAFLSSDRARYVTGQVIGVDGGFSLGNP